MHDRHYLVFLLFSGLFGAQVGSFLNVCIYRLPRHESVAWPGSHCPTCSHAIAWYDNIPIISYAVLLGHCRHCGVRIPVRYPGIEILNALGYMGILWCFGFTWGTVAASSMNNTPVLATTATGNDEDGLSSYQLDLGLAADA